MNKRIWASVIMILLALNILLASGYGDVSFPKLKGWRLNQSTDVYTPDNLWDLINGAAESYLSYDFVDLHLADYKGRGGVEIHAEIYRHSSPNNAFGIYSSERSPEYNFVETGTQGYVDEGILNYFSGRYYIKLYSTGSGEMVQASLLEIGKAISDHLGQDNRWPELLKTFPPEGKLPQGDHYVRENFIGFNFLHSAFTAEYEGGYRLFVIQGKDRDEILEMVGAYLDFTKQDIDPELKSSFVVMDRYNGNIPVILQGSFMAGIIDGAENEQALESLKTFVNNLPENR